MKKFSVPLFILLLVLGFVVRLYKIDNPIADWHSWRQADTAAVTRNFVKFGVNIFIPRYDDFSDVSGKGLINPNGFRMEEFPLFNLIHFSFIKIFPQLTLEVWGRLTAIFSWLLASVVLFFLVKRHAGQTVGFLTLTLFLFLPYNIYFSRIILPDQLMVALSLLTLNFFDLWIRKEQRRLLILTGIFGALALLTKPMAVFLLLPMVWQARHKLKDFRLYVLAAGMLLPLLVWRDWTAKFPEGVAVYLWLLNGNHIRFKPAFFRWIFGERLASLILGKWGVVPLVFGIVASITSPYFLTWFLSALLYLTVFATGNIQHDYYQIVIMPAVSVIVALGIVKLFRAENTAAGTWTKRGLVVGCLILMLGLSWYDVSGDYQINHWEIIRAGQAIDRLTQKDAVVVAAYQSDSAFLYQTKRRGFPLLAGPIKDLHDLYGVSYYVSTTYDVDTNKLMQKYTVVEETPEYVIIHIEEPKIPVFK